MVNNLNKALHIKVIFEIYLKSQKIGLKYFKFSDRILFYKTSKKQFKNYILSLFLKILPKQNLNIK